MPIEWSFPSFNGHCLCYLLVFPIVSTNIAVVRSAAENRNSGKSNWESIDRQFAIPHTEINPIGTTKRYPPVQDIKEVEN